MSSVKNALISFSINHHKLAALLVVLATILACGFLPRMRVDTDPENMLPADNPARVFHNQSKAELEISETIVVGVVNRSHPDGAFNPETLRRVYELTEFAKTLRWEDEARPGSFSGVIEVDMLSPSLVDHMSQDGLGSVSFEWLMQRPPQSREEALEIRRKAFSSPVLRGRMFSDDGKVICIYLPLTDKHLSYRINEALSSKIASLGGDEEYHVAGVPVAEVAIGVEMFSQMSVGSPLAMVVIFVLLWIFFRKIRLVILPMIVAGLSVLSTMGLMVALGFPVHILSSMIPIFLMCIGTVSTIHILSELFDVLSVEKGKQQTIHEVMSTLFTPILYTSLTTAAGFASLTVTPIPPAQVFGAFLSIGVMISWLYTILLVPSYIMLIPERLLASFGGFARQGERQSPLTSVLQLVARLTQARPRAVLLGLAVMIAISIFGMTRIEVNDNYAKRFAEGHPIREADIALNRHLDGTYAAYLVLEDQQPTSLTRDQVHQLSQILEPLALEEGGESAEAAGAAREILLALPDLADQSGTYRELLGSVLRLIDERSVDASEEEYALLDELSGLVGLEAERQKVFKRPEVLRYMRGLQAHLEQCEMVGKCTSVADAVSKVHQELQGGGLESFRIPDRQRGVSECLFQLQQGHRPRDLWHMVTPDFKKASILIQLRTGDSRDMKAATEAVESYLESNPPPAPLSYRWAGLHYINLVLEEMLIFTMGRSFLGSFLIVLIMMAVLFRSLRWALLSMIPLTLTVMAIYGAIGLLGKDYDLPIAVLGVLALGMAVDFAIHFLQRSRQRLQEGHSWDQVIRYMFGEPARAISRNVMVIAIGFLPLLIAPLVPYKTMGIMLFAIMTLSGALTLLALPAALAVATRLRHRSAEAKHPKDCLVSGQP